MLEPIPFWGMIEVDPPVKTYAGDKPHYIKEDMNNKPVAWINKDEYHGWLNWDKNTEMPINIPLYTHPVKELTDEEMEEVIRKHWNKEYGNRNMLTLCKAVLKEAKK